jgi:hypothetical protein
MMRESLGPAGKAQNSKVGYNVRSEITETAS